VDVGDVALLGFDAKVEFEVGMAELTDWLRDQDAGRSLR
jgi:hypothetical protein